MDASGGAVVFLVVIVATVNELVDRTDEGFLVQDAESWLTSRDSPGLALPLLVAGLSLAAFVVRRRTT